MRIRLSLFWQTWAGAAIVLAWQRGLVCLLKKVITALQIRGQLQNSLRLLRTHEEWNTWTNESLNKSSSTFVSRPVIAKQFGALEWAHFLGFHSAPYLCQLLENTEISPVWADERETEPSTICILMILPSNCVPKKSEINLNLWDLTSESNPKPRAVTHLWNFSKENNQTLLKPFPQFF